MDMKKRGMSAMALLGALLLGSGPVLASEDLNTVLGGGLGGAPWYLSPPCCWPCPVTCAA